MLSGGIVQKSSNPRPARPGCHLAIAEIAAFSDTVSVRLASGFELVAGRYGVDGSHALPGTEFVRKAIPYFMALSWTIKCLSYGFINTF